MRFFCDILQSEKLCLRRERRKMAKLRIMTHNQWKADSNLPAWQEKGFDCSSRVRTQGFARVYNDLLPDIIGAQEVSAKMAEDIMEHLTSIGLNYAVLWGRDTPIFYRPDKFELVNSEFALYPDEFPGHEGIFNNGKTKSYCIGVFRTKEDGKLFIFASTHLWWKSSNDQPYSNEARAYQLGLLIDRIDKLQKAYDCPAVIVGDLNAGYNSDALNAAFSRGFLHAHDLATEYKDDSVGLHYCFPAGFYDYYYDWEFERAIDHILVRGADRLTVRRFERYSPEYYLPLSDHSPAFVDVEL